MVVRRESDIPSFSFSAAASVDPPVPVPISPALQTNDSGVHKSKSAHRKNDGGMSSGGHIPALCVVAVVFDSCSRPTYCSMIQNTPPLKMNKVKRTGLDLREK